MTPYPMDPVDATGPMRLVLCAFPDATSAQTAIAGALAGRLAACAQRQTVRSQYLWKGKVEEAEETLVVFKTVPKRVGALFRHLAAGHPYQVPEIVELDVPRVHDPYLRYLAETLDADSPPLPLGGGSPAPRPRRSGGRRAREAPVPGRTPRPRRLP